MVTEVVEAESGQPRLFGQVFPGCAPRAHRSGRIRLYRNCGTWSALGYFREALHAEKEHQERNISADDVIYGLELEDWSIASTPNYDEDHRSWEYLIRTCDIEGDELDIKIAAYPDEKRFEVLTRW